MACEVCKKPCVLSDDNSFDSDKKPHVCTTCGDSFSLKIQLKRHILTHDGSVPYICNTCEKQRDIDKQTYNLRLSKKGNYSCETCNKSFSTKRMLLRHASQHTSENVIDCDICGESFKNVTALKKHSAVHKVKKSATKNDSQNEIPEMLHVCNDCGLSFTQFKQFETHRRSHIINFKCNVCDKFFFSGEILKKHQSSGDCLAKSKPISLLKISNINNSSNSSSDDKKHMCVICNKIFARKSALEGHMTTHLTEKTDSPIEDDSDMDVDFNCSYKGNKSEEQSKQLCLPKLKLRRSFPCEKCEKVCASKNLLEKHMLFHHKTSQDSPEYKKKYTCRICKEAFYIKEEYKKHKLTHPKKPASVDKEQKTYTCKVCNKVFHKKKHLKKHALSHSQEGNVQEASSGKKLKRKKEFACGVCGKRFAGETCLKKHEARHIEKGDDGSSRKGKRSKKPIITICEICEADYTHRRHAFIKHKQSHTPEVCGICDARFADRPSLREHLKTHIGTEEARRFLECSQRVFNAKNAPEAKVEYIYLVLR